MPRVSLRSPTVSFGATCRGRAPTTRRAFKGLNLNISKFDSASDRKRGAATRLASVLLLEDSETLLQRVCADERTARTYEGAAGRLQREARYLRRMAGMLEMTMSLLNTVLIRCRERGASGHTGQKQP